LLDFLHHTVYNRVMKRRNTGEHRRVWRQHHGPIPKDADGRSYDIHHIDGDPENNDITNLIALTIHEHYEVHYWQEDLAACRAVAMRGIVSPEDASRLSSELMLARIEAGTSPFQDPEFLKRKSEETRQRNLELAAIGANPWQDPEFIERERERKRDRENALVEAGTHLFQTEEHQTMLKKVNDDRIAAGTHNWQDSEIARQQQMTRIENGTHTFLKRDDGTSIGADTTRRLIEDGEHHFLDKNPNDVRCSCLVCHKETNVPGLGKHKKCRGEEPAKVALNLTGINSIRVSCIVCHHETNYPSLSRHIKTHH
jgi:hypothetical protein